MERVKKSAGGAKHWRKIEIRRCTNESCRTSHRLLPDDQVPFKHYEEELIEKVTDGSMTEEDELEAEDYPSDETKLAWRRWAVQLVKNAEGQCRAAMQKVMDLPVRVLSSGGSLLEEIRKRVKRGWMSVMLRVMVDTGGLGTLP